MLPRENLKFLNVRNAGFWHPSRLFALLQMQSLENLKDFFGAPPLNPLVFPLDPPPPFKAIFLSCLFMPPPQIPPAHLPDKKGTVPKVHFFLQGSRRGHFKRFIQLAVSKFDVFSGS